jgi:hypothetical protein
MDKDDPDSAQKNKEDKELTLKMAREAHDKKVRVPGNFINTKDETVAYPTDTAPAMSPGFTLGQWGSRKVAGGRPSMNIVLIETFGNATTASSKEADKAARKKELMTLAQILRNFFLAP